MPVNNTPSAQGWSYDYVSTLEPLLEKYAISDSIYRAFGDQKYNAYMLVKELGWQAPVNQVQGHHFEQTRINQTVLVESNASGAAGAAVVVDIDPTAFNNGKTYIRENWTIIFPDYQTAWVKDVDTAAEQMTIVPFDSTYAISVSAGDELAVGPSAWGEGTSQPIGEVQGYVQRNFWTQILKENSSATGTAMTDEASVNVKQLAAYIKNAPAELGNTLVAMCQADIDYRMTVQISNMLYWSQENDNSSLIVSQDAAAMGGGVYTTKGLNQVVDDLGNTENYVVGTLSLSNFYTMGDYLDQQMVSPETPILWRMGRGQNVEYEQMLQANNAINFQAIYTKDQINGKIFNKKAGKEVFFNYRDLTLGSYTFCASVEPTFTDPKGVGAPNYQAKDLGFLIPMTGGNDRDGKQMDSICVRYKNLGSYNRMFETWTTDWHQNNYDIKAWQLRCNLGVQFFGANRFIKLQGN